MRTLALGSEPAPARWRWLTRAGVVLALAVCGACGLEPLGSAPAGAADAGPDGGVGGTGLGDSSFGGSTGDADAALEAEAAVLLPYAFRRRLSVAAGANGAPAGASLLFRFDHQALVLAGKARADGKDLRVFFKGSGPSQELDRVLDPVSGWDRPDTTLWFRSQAPMGGQPDESYYVYYGDAAAAAEPPADPGNVYAFFDDFDGTQLSPGWVGTPVGSASGTFTVQNGVVRISGTTGDIWGYGDDFLFLYRSISGNFVIDAKVVAFGGSGSGWSKFGGAMLRESLAKGSKNRLVSPVNGGAAITSSYRLGSDSDTLEAAKSGANAIPEYVRLARRFDGARAWHSDDGIGFTELGAETTFTGVLPDALLVGIPFANLIAVKGFVDVDWFRIRVLLEIEPTVSEQPEEPGPFSL